MTRSLPPLDLHAHISPKADATDLERLGAVVFAATRTLDEYKSVKDRNDRVTIWGVGCHPGIPEAQSAYDPSKFTELISSSAYIGEVGLDGRSRVPMTDQDRVFRSILTHLQQTPRILSVHSSGAAGRTLEALEATRVKGAVLHWWRGTEEQTKRALDLGCRFSVNAANMRHATDLLMIPMNRILIETDHPSGNRSSSSPRQPGSIFNVEAALAKLHGTTTETIRRETWVNFAHLVDEVAVETLLPNPVQRMLFVARN